MEQAMEYPDRYVDNLNICTLLFTSMQPKDRFGNTIFPNVYSRLLNIGGKLQDLGFTEARSQNLFYLSVSDATVFADMRGTSEVKIWEDPVPLVYIRFRKELPLWKRNRIRNTSYDLLKAGQVPFRESFYEEAENWMEPYYYLQDKQKEITGKSDKISDEIFYEYTTERVFFGPFYNDSPNPSVVDGYCKKCGKDIQRDTSLCDRCFNIEYYKRQAKIVYDEYKEAISKLRKCFACQKYIYLTKSPKMIPTDYETQKWLYRYHPEKGHLHHIEYQPVEKTIELCTKCHNTIHHTDKYPELKPKPGESRKFYHRNREG